MKIEKRSSECFIDYGRDCYFCWQALQPTEPLSDLPGGISYSVYLSVSPVRKDEPTTTTLRFDMCQAHCVHRNDREGEPCNPFGLKPKGKSRSAQFMCWSG